MSLILGHVEESEVLHLLSLWRRCECILLVAF